MINKTGISRTILIVISVLFIVFSILLNLFLRANIQESVKNSLAKDTEIISVEVRSFLSNYIGVVNLMSTNDTFITYIRDVKQPEDKENHPLYEDVLYELTKVVDLYANIRLTWVGMNAINEFLNYNPTLRYDGDEYTYFDRPWYIAMIEAEGDVGVSPIFLDIRNDEPIISIVKPIYADVSQENDVHNNIGQVAIDLSINDLADYISSYKVGDEGFAVLSDENGVVISNTSHTGALTRYLNSDANLIRSSVNTSPRYTFTSTVTLADEDYYISGTSVGVGTWSVYTLIPVSEFSDQLFSVDAFTGLIFLSIIIILIAINNIRRLRTQEAYIRKMAYIDPLTEIHNRRSLIETFEATLEREARGAVMMLDLDNFKEINDTMGHVVGDKLLKEIAGYLEKNFGSNAFISRFGGDEFLLLFESKSIEAIENFAKSIVEGFNERFNRNTDFYVTFSMGIAFYPDHSIDVGELISYADATMYFVKQHGKNNFAIFDEHMIRVIHEKLSIEKTLNVAVENNGFKLLYQPKVATATYECTGLEALIRIKDDPLSPAKFIPIAEEQGLIIDIGRWVAEEVIKYLARLQAKGLGDIPVAINFSPKQLIDTGYLAFILEKLDLYDVAPEMLHIEVTESVLMSNLEEAADFVNSFKKAGLKLALDDFGTGFSSISYLTVIDVDYLKLDKSLSDKFLATEDARTIKSIIDLGHSLDIEVIAEGIETKDQIGILQNTGCDQIQGYYFSRPLPEEEATAYIKHERKTQ